MAEILSQIFGRRNSLIVFERREGWLQAGGATVHIPRIPHNTIGKSEGLPGSQPADPSKGNALEGSA